MKARREKMIFVLTVFGCMLLIVLLTHFNGCTASKEQPAEEWVKIRRVLPPKAPSKALAKGAAEAREPETRTYIISLKEGRRPDSLERRHGLQGRRLKRHLVAPLNYGQLKKLSADPDVLRIEPDAEMYVEPVMDTLQLVQPIPAGINRTEVPRQPAAKIDGLNDPLDTNKWIVSLDTGLDPGHPDLHVSVMRNFTDEAFDADSNYHGTHTGGTAAAIDNDFGVVGMAPGAHLASGKLLTRRGVGNFSWLLAGLEWVETIADRVVAVNVSLGAQGYYSQAINEQISRLLDLGVFVVVAAGNRDADIYGPDKMPGTMDDFFPASATDAVTVSSMVDVDGQPGGMGYGTATGGDDQRSTFSNYCAVRDDAKPFRSPGFGIVFAAPGTGIRSTWRNHDYGVLSGTSMAAPHVTGAIFLRASVKGKPHNRAEAVRFINEMIAEGQEQRYWRPDGDTRDADANHEPLVDVGQFGSIEAPALPPRTDAGPDVAVWKPAPDQSYLTVEYVVLEASAPDDQGSLAPYVDWSWRPAAGGAWTRIGRGSPLQTKFYAGNYWIRCEAWDRDGHYAADSVPFVVYQDPNNTAPITTIKSPMPAETTVVGYAEDTLHPEANFGYRFRFTGQATDAEQGNLTGISGWYYGNSLAVTGGVAPFSFSVVNATGPQVYEIVFRTVDASMAIGTDTCRMTVNPPEVQPPPPDDSVPLPPPPPVGPPAAPSGLQAMRPKGSTTWIVLTWQRNATDETAYVVWRRTPNGATSTYRLGPTATRHDDFFAKKRGKQEYWYGVWAEGAGGRSDTSNIVKIP